ncbi:MAG: Maf family protein, partial [Muribaculaceae bacterium]|nr:Maf family protein [Muribaculaceae bacterium]
VILDGEILGKPRSREDAIGMLGKMQSRTHTVVTGMTLSFADSPSISFSQKTEVHFDALSEEEIEYYVDNFRPYDKAGAYGIQEWIGAAAITGINGSFYNVMGLPVHALYLELKKCGISIADK